MNKSSYHISRYYMWTCKESRMLWKAFTETRDEPPIIGDETSRYSAVFVVKILPTLL